MIIAKQHEYEIVDAITGRYTEREIIDMVFKCLGNDVQDITEHLFPDAREEYKEEWNVLEPFDYWCKMDQLNQQRVIDWSKRYYEAM